MSPNLVQPTSTLLFPQGGSATVVHQLRNPVKETHFDTAPLASRSDAPGNPKEHR